MTALIYKYKHLVGFWGQNCVDNAGVSIPSCHATAHQHNDGLTSSLSPPVPRQRDSAFRDRRVTRAVKDQTKRNGV